MKRLRQYSCSVGFSFADGKALIKGLSKWFSCWTAVVCHSMAERGLVFSFGFLRLDWATIRARHPTHDAEQDI